MDAPVDRPAALPSRCPAEALLCDGFEKAELDGTLWASFSDPGASLAIDSTRGARGAGSMRLHLDPQSQAGVGLHWGADSSKPIPDPAYLRFFLLLPKPAPHFTGAFVTLDNDQNQSVAVEWSDSQADLDGLADVVTNPNLRVGIIDQGRWVCMRVKVQKSAPSELSLFLDDATTPGLTSALNSAPVLQRVMFAISPDGTQALPVDMWIDEVVLSPVPVACTD